MWYLHLADAFIQSDLQLHSGYKFSLACVFPGNWTHNLLRCWRNALPLSHTGCDIVKGCDILAEVWIGAFCGEHMSLHNA